MAAMTFRNSRIIYYGPHPCSNCGVNITKMSDEFGGTAFTYPQGPVYPNTEWAPHVCDPQEIYEKEANKCRQEVLLEYPDAIPYKVAKLGWVILGGPPPEGICDVAVAVSLNQSYCDYPSTAWRSAFERNQKDYPTWKVKLYKGKH